MSDESHHVGGNEEDAEQRIVDSAIVALEDVDGASACGGPPRLSAGSGSSIGTDSTPISLDGNNNSNASMQQKKKRYCRFPGCTKVIKSQGHCQRHGAKAKRCKVRISKCSKRMGDCKYSYGLDPLVSLFTILSLSQNSHPFPAFLQLL